MNKLLLTSLISSTFFALTATSSVATIQAAELNFAHIETVGTSTIEAAADMAIINVQVSIEAASAKKAKQKADEAVSQFMQRLLDAGVDKKHIQSANLQLNPQYEYVQNKPRKLTGYSANRQITVTIIELSNLNELLDSALVEGINQVNNIELKSSKEAEMMAQARQAAIKDAKQKAESLAKGFGEQVAGVWQVRYFPSQSHQPEMYRASMKMNADVAQTYQQGQVSVSDSVEAIFRLK
ncbi:oxidative stress defense protein [Shewanella inventionis]|uniref:Oxidative stress defense protein n=1 Tax=Shewanella inventionis TaxID=1738770 RepID=A0ABQ1IZN1_9GAMM|nr:oxidative stress defense protein [Shewanella inventionis]MCL1157075.1 oxidative stress defense protein [Shewanella inventionis]GGB55024.1 oxidative stress defense protein [Shewanella inventionis]